MTKCFKCANHYGDGYCTMFKDTKKAQYKKCDGFKDLKLLPKKTKRIIKIKKIRNSIHLKDENFSTPFMKFIKKGGHYSGRTGKIL